MTNDQETKCLTTCGVAPTVNAKAKDYEWVCNECNAPNFTSSVSEDELELELHSCITCGGFEFHKRLIFK